jgi:NTE family protein
MKRVGVALGAGGARGLAHIVVLQAFEELGIKPTIMAGTSIGAVIGAGFAAGLTTAEMKDAVEEIRTANSGRLARFYDNSELKFALAFLDPTIEPGGLIKGEKFIKFVQSKLKVKRFEDLEIPFAVIATHYWKREQVVLGKGNLLKAIQASYSMPGLFTPVKVGNDLYVDGGLVNPLPYDVIRPYCDITVAIDVSIRSAASGSTPLHAQDVLFSAFQIMHNSIIREKLNQSKPDVHIKIDMRNVRALEFNKTESIFEQALSPKEELKQRLTELLDGNRARHKQRFRSSLPRPVTGEKPGFY